MSRPPDIIQKSVCSDTGLSTATNSNNASCPTRFEYILKGTEATKGQITTGDTQIDKTTQDLPAKGQADNLDTKTETVYTDPTGDKFCLTCPHPSFMPSPTPTPNH
jgi:hypothetical protein